MEKKEGIKKQTCIYSWEQNPDEVGVLEKLELLGIGTFIRIVGCDYIAVKKENNKWLITEDITWYEHEETNLIGRIVEIVKRYSGSEIYLVKEGGELFNISGKGIIKSIELLNQKQFRKMFGDWR